MKKILGIELGSTRIKSVLTDENAVILAQGVYEWENVLVDGLWSYPMSEVEKGIRESYASLVKNYGQTISTLDAIGVSAMMHGHLAFDKDDNLLVPFRTWRNTHTLKASEELSTLLSFNVPMRWSCSQYYQAVLDNEDHVKNIAHLNTLAGYVHYRLTGERVLGLNDGSGVFPLDGDKYDKKRMVLFNERLKEKGVEVDFESLIPKVLPAGSIAGRLTEEGAKWLDETGNLQAGCILCPPEGDMGTGIVATNSVSPNTANVSAGTSVNMTVTLGKPLNNYYKELDVIATPDGNPAVIIHSNNCTTEINAWVETFDEVLKLFGKEVPKGELYEKLFKVSLDSDNTVGEIVSYNFTAGEPIVGTMDGSPMTLRSPDGNMSLANFMQSQMYSAVAPISFGVGILENEGVKVEKVLAHGGFYKTDFVGQNATSAMLKIPVTVQETASEGGAWGMALLALFSTVKGKTLPQFLQDIFGLMKNKVVMASEEEISKCDNFMKNYKKMLKTAKLASELFKN